MLFVNRQFFCWLLVLVMMVSPIQVTMASDFAQQSHGMNCHKPDHGINAVVSANCCKDPGGSDHTKICIVHPECVAQFSTSLIPSSLVVAMPRSVSLIKFIAEHKAVLTHYPSLLKRPPKAI